MSARNALSSQQTKPQSVILLDAAPSPSTGTLFLVVDGALAAPSPISSHVSMAALEALRVPDPPGNLATLLTFSTTASATGGVEITREGVASWPVAATQPAVEATAIPKRAGLLQRLLAALTGRRRSNVNAAIDPADERLASDAGLGPAEVRHRPRADPAGSFGGRVDPFVTRWAIAVAALTAATLALICATSSHAAAADYEAHGPLVPSVLAPASLKVQGRIEPTRTIAISTQRSGILRRVLVEPDQRVVAGQILAELELDEFEAEVAKARAKLAAALAKVRDGEVSLLEKRRDLDRRDMLAGRGFGAKKDAEAARAAHQRAVVAVDMARADVTVAEVELAMQQTALAQATIRSPIDGFVLRKKAEAGEMVLASNAPVLFTIAADLGTVVLKITLAEADVGRVKPGQLAAFTVTARPGRAFSATLRQVRISPRTGVETTVYDAILVVDNADRALWPGMSATVAIEIEPVAGVADAASPGPQVL